MKMKKELQSLLEAVDVRQDQLIELLKHYGEAWWQGHEQGWLIDIGFELNSALVTGNTDAVIGAYINHEVPVLKHNGFNTRYFNPVDYGVPAYNEIVLVTSDDTLEKDQEAIQAFWKAAKKGYEFMKENPDEALAYSFR